MTHISTKTKMCTPRKGSRGGDLGAPLVARCVLEQTRIDQKVFTRGGREETRQISKRTLLKFR
jgi:hypothetical protein